MIKKAESAPENRAGGAGLTHLELRERLEIHRVAKTNDNVSFAYVGALNMMNGKEYKPFLHTLSADERRFVDELFARKSQEFRDANAVDVEQLTSNLLELAHSVYEGFTRMTPEQESRLTFAWQRVRQSFKNAQKTA
jgi:hypothetical protein